MKFLIVEPSPLPILIPFREHQIKKESKVQIDIHSLRKASREQATCTSKSETYMPMYRGDKRRVNSKLSKTNNANLNNHCLRSLIVRLANLMQFLDNTTHYCSAFTLKVSYLLFAEPEMHPNLIIS